MKFLLATILFISTHFITPLQWLTDIKVAKAEAGQSNKLILVNFSGSDWCGPCIRLHKDIFESAAFENYATATLVLVNADFPRLKKNQLSKDQVKRNEALADVYNPQGTFPLTLLLDASGKVLKKWEGYPDESPEKFIGEINALTHAGR
jgi:thioredoxin-related protein